MAKAKQALSRRTGHTGLSTSEPVPVLVSPPAAASTEKPSTQRSGPRTRSATRQPLSDVGIPTPTPTPAPETATSNTDMTATKRKRKRTGSTLDLNLDDYNNNSTHSATTASSQKKRRRIAPIDNDSDDDNSDNSNDSDEDNGDNSNDSYSNDSDVWESRPLSARARAEVARLAKSAGDLSDLHKPKGPGNAKQPYYRMTPAQKLQHRRPKQRTQAQEEQLSSLYLTPRQMELRKRSSKKVMLDYLQDWEAFVKEKDAATKSRRERRAEVSRMKKDSATLDLATLLLSMSEVPEVPEVKPRPTEAHYCDAKLDGDYTVVSAPVLDYITTKVFTDYVIKRIAPETSYKGIIGFKRSECTDPSLDQPKLAKEQGQEQTMDMDMDVDVNDLDGIMKSKYPASKLSKSKWTSMEQPTEPKLDLIAWQIDKALNDAMSERLQANIAYEVVTEGAGPIDDGDPGPSTTQQQRQASEMSQSGNNSDKNLIIPSVALIGSLAEKTQVLENAPVDKEGKKLLRIPPTYGTTETALKAM
ncbi:hypothetical protein BGZ97_005836, partial [Linnemannia gamsii]